MEFFTLLVRQDLNQGDGPFTLLVHEDTNQGVGPEPGTRPGTRYGDPRQF